MFRRINRHDLYYLLGFGFLDFKVQDGSITLTKRRHGGLAAAVEELSFQLFNRQPTYAGADAIINIQEEEVVKFLLEEGVGASKRYLPSISDDFAWAFIAGYFDAYGELSYKNHNTRVFVQSPVHDVITFIAKHWQVKTNYADKVLANGYKALDICGCMYQNVSARNPGKYIAYMDLLNIRGDKAVDGRESRFEYVKLHPNAVEPQKTYVTDSGFDLHVLEMTPLYKTPWGAQIYQGKTELAIKPVMGYAFDINGRSSLPKNGWLFLQGTGICDRSYTGGVQATFMKMNDEPLPKMPWKALQVVPREAPLHTQWIEKKDLGESFRGTGGFGSTGDMYGRKAG